MEKKFEFELETERLMLLLEGKDYLGLQGELATEKGVNVAEFIEELSEEQGALVFHLLAKELAAEVFSNLPARVQETIIESVSDIELGAIVSDLFLDDAVDMLEELPANVVKRVLKNADPQTRLLINQLLNYPAGSAGSIMTPELIELEKTMSVKEAIAKIRMAGEDCESIYTCYVMDKRRVLEGVITLRELLMAQDDQNLGALMNRDVIFAETTEDREEVVQRMMRYDFIAMPVVDSERRLVGVVTVDDVMDVMEEEATEDFEKMAAILPSEKPYLETNAFILAKNRIIWLLILMVSAMITGGILGRYEAAFAAMPLLVTFIPMLTDTGGNAGSQSSTLIIRGMAVGDITKKDFLKVFGKELQVSLLVGVTLGALNYLRLILMYPGKEAIALTVALSLFATVVLAKTLGGLLPMAAKIVKVDPAIMAAPLITTIVDAFALVIYFSLAEKLVLGL